MKICVVSYFGLRDALESATKELSSLGHTITDYPLYKYKIHGDTKIDNVTEHFISFLEKETPEALLWWYLPCDNGCFIEIKQRFPEIKYYFFNWDEPFNWKSNDMKTKARFFDCVFVCCDETTKWYTEHGCPKAVYCLPGYDPEVFRPIDNDSRYRFDVSMVLTNLYADKNYFPDQVTNRKELVDAIYRGQSEHGYKLAIYGPEGMRKVYPDSYQGYCQYREQNLVFNESRINLTTHVVGNRSGYLNERTVTLIGSGALILIDNVSGLNINMKKNRHCLVLNKEDPVKQILAILEGYEKKSFKSANRVKRRLSDEVRDKHTWAKWAEIIDNNICRPKQIK